MVNICIDDILPVSLEASHLSHGEYDFKLRIRKYFTSFSRISNDYKSLCAIEHFLLCVLPAPWSFHIPMRLRSFGWADGAHYDAYYNSSQPLWLELVLIELAVVGAYCRISWTSACVLFIWYGWWFAKRIALIRISTRSPLESTEIEMFEQCLWPIIRYIHTDWALGKN